MVILSLPLPIHLRVIPHIPIPKLVISILIYSTKPADFFHNAFIRYSPVSNFFGSTGSSRHMWILGAYLSHANGEVMRAENVVREPTWFDCTLCWPLLVVDLVR